MQLIDQFVGDAGGRFVFAAGQVEVLDAGGQVGVPHALEDALVEVLVLGPHAAHVERHHRFERLDHHRRFRIICAHVQMGGGSDLEVGPGPPGTRAGEPFVEPFRVHRSRARRVEDRYPTVGDLSGLGDIARPLGTEPDR